MSLYHIVFLFLLVGVLIEYNRGITPIRLFRFTFLALCVLMAVRFGQGTDYYSYCAIFTTMPTNLKGILSYEYAEAEVGWRILCAVFKLLGFSFKGFVVLLTFVEMFLLWRFLSRFCKNYMLALFLSYHTLYLTYYFSAMRQALVISIFLGYLLDLLIQGKYFKYCVCVIACSFLHSVALVLLLAVFLRMIHLSYTQMVCATVIGCMIGMILSILNVGKWLLDTGIVNIASAYLGETDISLVALMERLITYIIVAYAFFLYLDGQEPEQSDKLLIIFKIYSLGVLIYGLLMWSSLISSRAVYMFKIMEIPLLCTCITKCKKMKPVILLYCILICSALYVKNIGSYISQGRYLDFNIMNYPYVSIFDHEKIAEYRKDTGFRIDWLEFDFDQDYVNELKRVYLSLEE